MKDDMLTAMNAQHRIGKAGMAMDFFEETFNTPAKRLAFLLRDRGISQQALGDVISSSASFVSQVVNGKKGFIPEDWLRVSVYFGVTLDWLLCRPGAPMYWPTDVPERVPDWSTWADEGSRLIDSLPPRRRDEAIQLLRVLAFNTQATEAEIEETVRELRGTLASANLVLSPRAIDAIKASMLTFAFGGGSGGG